MRTDQNPTRRTKDQTMRKLTMISPGTIREDVLGEGPSPKTAATVCDRATIRTTDGRERIVKIVAYGASRARLAANDLDLAA